MSYLDDIEYISKFILSYRTKKCITEDLSTSPLREMSGFAAGVNGDIKILLYTQLVNTKVGYGSWAELKDDVIRRAVVSLIKTDRIDLNI